jgi:hypothetical protein
MIVSGNLAADRGWVRTDSQRIVSKETAMSSIQFAYLLMIAGALLVAVGVVGLALRRNKEDEADPLVTPEDVPWMGLRSDSPPRSPHHLKTRNTAVDGISNFSALNSFAAQGPARSHKPSAA